MKLAEIVREKNVEVIEVYPHATKIALCEKGGDEDLLRELTKRAPVKKRARIRCHTMCHHCKVLLRGQALSKNPVC